MKKFVYIFITILFFFFNFSNSFASQDGININLDVKTCNNNNICESGEDFLSCPIDCSTSENVSGGSIPVNQQNIFTNFTVEPSYTSAVIKWNSVIPTIYVLKWGENPDFKNGTLKNVHFVNDHSVEITGLKTDTLYYFSIDAETYVGKSISLENQTFRTLVSEDRVAPSNPKIIEISSVLSGVTLTWRNPPEKDFAYIRIMRNEDRFHSDPYSGKIVYEGSGQYLRDGDVQKGMKYFYSVFARDTVGNFSSGSMADITYTPPETPGEQIITPPVQEEEKLPVPSTLVSYKVLQGEVSNDFPLGGTISINGNESIKIIASFSSERITDDMWIEIRNDRRIREGRYFFVDTKDDVRSKIVTVPPIEGNGNYSVFIYRYQDGLPVMIHQGGFNSTYIIEKEETPKYFILWATLISIVIFAMLWWLIRKIFLIIIYRKKKKKEEEMKTTE